MNEVVRLFPKLDFGEFAVEPAVADDAVLRRRFAGEIIGLRGAGDGGKRGRDVRERAAPAKFRDARRVFADERLGEADDVDDGEPVHFVASRAIREWPATIFCVVHFVDFHAAPDFLEQRDGQFAAEVFAEFFEAGQNCRQICVVRVQQFVGEQFEAEFFQQIQNARGGCRIQQTDVARVNHVERDADGHGVAVAKSGNAKAAPACARPSGRNPAGARNPSQTDRRWWRCGRGAARRSGG